METRIDTEYFRVLKERGREQDARHARVHRHQLRQAVFQAILGVFYLLAGVESFIQDYGDLALKSRRVEGGTLDERIATAADNSFYLPAILSPM